ncbi:peptidoglycan editing factor PgeF [soil metagenome]
MDRSAESQFRLVERSGLPVLEWPIFDGHPVKAVVTTRQGGVSAGPYHSLNLGLHVGDEPSAVVENRRRAAAAAGLTLDDLVFCNQSHGRSVTGITAADRGRGARTLDDAIPDSDALVTDEPNLGLVVMVADCVPIVLFDQDSPSLACVHAGWRGTVARVVEAAIETMQARGADSGRILAAIGPAISPDRYEVGDDVKAAAEESFGAMAEGVLTAAAGGKWLFDLWTANRRLLVEAGVRPENISLAALGTGDGRFFSDRTARPCGRFAAIARLDAG